MPSAIDPTDSTTSALPSGVGAAYNDTRESSLFAKQQPAGFGYSTWDQMLQAAWSPSAPDKIDKKALFNLYYHTADVIQKYRTSANREMMRGEVERWKARVSLAANQKRFAAALQETGGKDRRAALKSMSDALVAINNDMTYLAKTNNQVIERYYALAKQYSEENGGDNVLALQKVFGDLETEGQLIDGNVDLPMIMQRLEEGFAPAGADGVRRFENIPSELLRNKALDLRKRAESQRHQETLMRDWLDESTKEMQGFIDEVGKGHDLGQGFDLPDLADKANAYNAKLDKAIGTISDKSPEQAESDLNAFMKEDEYYQGLQNDLNKMSARLFAKDSQGDDYRIRMAKILATPKFQAWAADHGLTIGKVELDADGNVKSYVPNEHDAFALALANWEMKHPDMKIHGRNTGEWVKANVLIPGSEDPSNEPALANGKYAYVIDPDGRKQYLNDEQLNAYAKSNNLSEYSIGVGTITSPNEKNPSKPTVFKALVLKNNVTGEAFVADADGKWQPAGQEAVDAVPADEWHVAATASDDGKSLRPFEKSDIASGAAKTQTLDKDEEQQFNLHSVGEKIKFSDTPDSQPRYRTVYGKRKSMMANDELGSVRILSEDGEVYIPPDQLEKPYEVTQKSTGTSAWHAFNAMRGRRAEMQAMNADDNNPSPKIKTNIFDSTIHHTLANQERYHNSRTRDDLRAKATRDFVPAAEPKTDIVNFQDQNGNAASYETLTPKQQAQIDVLNSDVKPPTVADVRLARGNDRPGYHPPAENTIGKQQTLNVMPQPPSRTTPTTAPSPAQARIEPSARPANSPAESGNTAPEAATPTLTAEQLRQQDKKIKDAAQATGYARRLVDAADIDADLKPVAEYADKIDSIVNSPPRVYLSRTSTDAMRRRLAAKQAEQDAKDAAARITQPLNK